MRRSLPLRQRSVALDFRYDETAMRALRVETILREVMPPEPKEEEGEKPDDASDE